MQHLANVQSNANILQTLPPIRTLFENFPNYLLNTSAQIQPTNSTQIQLIPPSIPISSSNNVVSLIHQLPPFPFYNSQHIPLDEEQPEIRLITAKKRRKKYTIMEKLNIIAEYEKAKVGGKNLILLQNDIDKSMISKWIQQKQKYKEALVKDEEVERRTKQPRFSIHSGVTTILSTNLEQQLINTIMNLRAAMIPIMGPMVRILALQLAEQNSIQNFTASDGWLDNFKRRHNLSLRKGTKRSVKVPTNVLQQLQNWQTESYNTIIENNIDYIINIDETPVMYDMGEGSTLHKRGSQEVLIQRLENGKKRITVVLGIIKPMKESLPKIYKCKPMIIYKGKTNRILSGVDPNRTKTCVLKYNEKAWATENTFIDFIKECIPEEIRSKKLFITFDGFSGHTTEAVNQIFAELQYHTSLFPANTTACIQPLDVAINKPFKCHIRTAFTRFMIEKKQVGELIAAQDITREKLREWVDFAWKSISQETIDQSFNCCGIGVAPTNTLIPIYWKKLHSLQTSFLNSTIPAVQQILHPREGEEGVFRTIHINDQTPPTIYVNRSSSI